jgi:hypothetical protein
MGIFEKEMAAMELGCKPSEVVDLTQACEAVAKKGTKAFLENYRHTDIFEMSFDRGDCITVRVIGESVHSTPNDRKFDVIVVNAVNNSGYPLPDCHKTGGRRWVRAYDLKATGTYSNQRSD